jgi:hypothetical protein
MKPLLEPSLNMMNENLLLMQEFLVAVLSVTQSSINCSKNKLKLCDLENFTHIIEIENKPSNTTPKFTHISKSAPLVSLVKKKENQIQTFIQ